MDLLSVMVRSLRATFLIQNSKKVLLTNGWTSTSRMVILGIAKQSSMNTNSRVFQKALKVSESPVSKVALPSTTMELTTAWVIQSTRTPSCLTAKANYQDATDPTAPSSTTMLVRSNVSNTMDIITMSINSDTPIT